MDQWLVVVVVIAAMDMEGGRGGEGWQSVSLPHHHQHHQPTAAVQQPSKWKPPK
jgi:hypothetical protein